MNKKIEDKLAELEKTSWDFRNITRDTGILLNTLIRVANFKNILESGTSNGYSGLWLAEAVSHHRGHVTTIDIDPARVELAEKNFRECELSQFITAKLGDSLEVMKQLDGQFDMVFVDGGKDYLELFNFAGPKLLQPNGIFAFDNAINHKDQLRDFLEAVEKDPRYQKVTINIGHGLLIALKLG